MAKGRWYLVYHYAADGPCRGKQERSIALREGLTRCQRHTAMKDASEKWQVNPDCDRDRSDPELVWKQPVSPEELEGAANSAVPCGKNIEAD